MRHGDKINNLGRKKAHREALLSNLAIALITHKRIVTTLAKAKALRTYVEPLLTKTKKGDNKETISHQHRVVFSHLQDKAAVKELFTVVGPKIASRPGGYTRILKLGIRPGDAAEKAMIELVDFNEVYGVAQDTAAQPAKRTRRAGSKKKAAGEEAATAEVVADTTVAEEATSAEVPATEEKSAE
jgi:large subunit ribosomal protein L17